MPKYADMIKTAQKDRTIKKIDVEYIKWEKEGTQVIGQYRGHNQVEDEATGKSYFQYIFDTDDGPKKFAPGSAFDGELGQMMSVGNIYALTYKGKEDIGKGHKVNRFELFEIPAFVSTRDSE